MIYLSNFKTHYLALCAAALLAACGGGGGGGQESASDTGGRIAAVQGAVVDLNNPTLATAVVANSAESVNYANGLSVDLDGFTGFVSGVQGQSPVGAKVSAVKVGQLLARRLQQAPALGVARAAETQTQNCDAGGTLQVTAQQAQADTLTAGDSFTLTATNCVVNTAAGQMALRGQMRMDVAAGSSAYGSLANLTLDFRMTPLVVSSDGVELGMDGGFRIGMDSSGEVVSLASLADLPHLTYRAVIAGKEEKTTLSYFLLDMTSATLSGKATVSTTQGFASPAQYSWETTQPISVADTGVFTSGQILIWSGTASTRLRLSFGPVCSTLSAYNNCVLYERASDGVNFSVVQPYTWQQFLDL